MASMIDTKTKRPPIRNGTTLGLMTPVRARFSEIRVALMMTASPSTQRKAATPALGAASSLPELDGVRPRRAVRPRVLMPDPVPSARRRPAGSRTRGTSRNSSPVMNASVQPFSASAACHSSSRASASSRRPTAQPGVVDPRRGYDSAPIGEDEIDVLFLEEVGGPRPRHGSLVTARMRTSPVLACSATSPTLHRTPPCCPAARPAAHHRRHTPGS